MTVLPRQRFLNLTLGNEVPDKPGIGVEFEKQEIEKMRVA
jgi:hypothetical protein